MELWAGKALFFLEIEVFGMETLYALISSPKSGGRAATLESCVINNLVGGAVLAGFVLLVIILVLRTWHTLFSIENWGSEWAVYTFFQIDVVDLVDWATETFFKGEIEVFREKALHTEFVIPKSRFRTNTLPVLICFLPSRTVLADFIVFIIVLVDWASHTFHSIKDRCIFRAVHTFLEHQIVDLVGWATQALFLIKIEILWVIALNTPESCEELINRTFALFRDIVVHSVEGTRCAGSQLFVPILGRRTSWAFEAIEEGQVGRAVDTNSIINIISHTWRTVYALFQIEIKILWQVAFDAFLISPKLSTHTFATFAFLTVDSAPTASIAILDCKIPECAVRAGHTFVSRKDWGFYRTFDAEFALNIIYLILGTTQALEGLEIKILGMVAFNTGEIVIEGVCILADACSSFWTIDSVVGTEHTIFGSLVPVSRKSARHTFGSIKLGLVRGARHTRNLNDIIYLIIWAAEALLLVIIPVLRMETLHTNFPVPEGCFITLTHLPIWIVVPSAWTTLAEISGFIVESILRTFLAWYSVVIGLLFWAVWAPFSQWVVYLAQGTIFAPFIGKVEVFGQITSDTLDTVKEESGGTFTGFAGFIVKSSSPALSTLVSCCIKEVILGAGDAFLSIEYRCFFRAWNTLLFN